MNTSPVLKLFKAYKIIKRDNKSSRFCVNFVKDRKFEKKSCRRMEQSNVSFLS